MSGVSFRLLVSGFSLGKKGNLNTEQGLVEADMIHIYNRILFCHKKEWNHVICSNMDRPGEHHTKRNKSDRERQILYDITCMWNLKSNRNQFIYKAEIDSQT